MNTWGKMGFVEVVDWIERSMGGEDEYEMRFRYFGMRLLGGSRGSSSGRKAGGESER